MRHSQVGCKASKLDHVNNTTWTLSLGGTFGAMLSAGVDAGIAGAVIAAVTLAGGVTNITKNYGTDSIDYIKKKRF